MPLLNKKSLLPILMSLFVWTGATCPVTEDDPLVDASQSGQFSAEPKQLTTLRIINQSGLDVAVDLTYFNEGIRVRESTRIFAPAGAAATETVLPTVTDAVQMVFTDINNPGPTYNFNLTINQLQAVNGNYQFIIPPPGQLHDCNTNGFDDAQDIAQMTSLDCNNNTIPDECEPQNNFTDCNNNNVSDICDLAAITSADCNNNQNPDECDIAGGTAFDCNTNGVPDGCEINNNPGADCDSNLILDVCDIAAGSASDCNNNGILDSCDLAGGFSDCNSNGIIDVCDIAGVTSLDCDNNGIPDACDLSAGTSFDCNNNMIPDQCEPPTAMHVIVALSDRIVRTDDLGTPPVDIVTAVTPRKMELDVVGDSIFFVHIPSVSGDVVRIPLAGGTPTLVQGPYDSVAGLGIDRNTSHLYAGHVRSGTLNTITRFQFNGAAETDIINSLADIPTDLEVDVTNSKIYYTLGIGTDQVRKVNLDGSSDLLLANTTNPHGIVHDPVNNRLIWVEHSAAGTIRSSDLNGGNQQTIITGTVLPTAVAIDKLNCKLYWVGFGSGGVGFLESSNFDGSNRQVLVTGINSPQDVKIYPK